MFKTISLGLVMLCLCVSLSFAKVSGTYQTNVTSHTAVEVLPAGDRVAWIEMQNITASAYSIFVATHSQVSATTGYKLYYSSFTGQVPFEAFDFYGPIWVVSGAGEGTAVLNYWVIDK